MSFYLMQFASVFTPFTRDYRCMAFRQLPLFVYCGYGMTIPQKISLTFNKADNDLPIFFTNPLVNWKVDSQLFKEPLS